MDSTDYFILRELNTEKFKPSIIMIETNSGLPNDIPLVMNPKIKPSSNTWYFGANLLAVYDLAKEKGYEFVTTVRYNAIFIRKDYFQDIGINLISREDCIKFYFKPSNFSVSRIKNNLPSHKNYLTF